MPNQDPVTGRFIPRDWDAWRREHASDYRTTKHPKQCTRCHRWFTLDAFGTLDCQCNECRSLDCLRNARRRKAKRVAAKKRKLKNQKKKNE